MEPTSTAFPPKTMSPGYIEKKIKDFVLHDKESFKGSSCHFRSATFIKENKGDYLVCLLGIKMLRGEMYVWHSFVKDNKTKKTVFDCNPEYTKMLSKDKNMFETRFEIKNI